jgi:hypothetical protein
MTAFDVGSAFGLFAAMLGVCAVWLLICYAIPPLRRRPKISYGIAIALAVGLAFVPIGGPARHAAVGAKVGTAASSAAPLG